MKCSRSGCILGFVSCALIFIFEVKITILYVNAPTNCQCKTNDLQAVANGIKHFCFKICFVFIFDSFFHHRDFRSENNAHLSVNTVKNGTIWNRTKLNNLILQIEHICSLIHSENDDAKKAATGRFAFNVIKWKMLMPLM